MFMGCGCHCLDESIDSRFSVQPSFVSQSYSVNSFGSSIADPPGNYPSVPCSQCGRTAAAAVYEVTWIYNGEPGDAFDPRPCCQEYKRQVKYKVYADPGAKFPPLVSGCAWNSRENAHMEINLKNGGLTCYEAKWPSPGIGLGGRIPMVNMTFSTQGSILEQVPHLRLRKVRINFLWQYFGAYDPADPGSLFLSVGQAEYEQIYPDGRWAEETLDPPPSCLGPMTFRHRGAFSPSIDLGRGPMWSSSTPQGLFGLFRGAPCKQVLFSGFDLGLPEYITVVPVPA